MVHLDILLQVRQYLGDLVAFQLHLFQSPLSCGVTALGILLQLLRVFCELLLQVPHRLHLLDEAVMGGFGHLLRLADLLLIVPNDGRLLFLEFLLCQWHLHALLFRRIGWGRLLQGKNSLRVNKKEGTHAPLLIHEEAKP